MKPKDMRKILFLLVLLVACVSARANSLVAEADSAYNQGEFVQAVRLYHQAVTNTGGTPVLYYNLGNSYYRIGKLGRAVICYERALKMDPSFTDARTNLDFVNTKILDKPEDDSTFLSNVHTGIKAWMSPNAWAWVAFGLFILVLGCIALYVFSGNVILRKVGFFGGGVVLVIFFYAFIVSGQVAAAPYNRNTAVVIVPTTNLSTSPGNVNTKDSKIIPVHEGTVVEIVDSMAIPGETSSPLWYDVKINNATRAWVRAVDVEKI